MRVILQAPKQTRKILFDVQRTGAAILVVKEIICPLPFV